jgi:hypothetical protein
MGEHSLSDLTAHHTAWFVAPGDIRARAALVVLVTVALTGIGEVGGWRGGQRLRGCWRWAWWQFHPQLLLDPVDEEVIAWEMECFRALVVTLGLERVDGTLREREEDILHDPSGCYARQIYACSQD